MQILKPLRAALVQVVNGEIQVQEIAPGATIILLDEVAPPAAEVSQLAPQPAPVLVPVETNAGLFETNAPVRESRTANTAPKLVKAETSPARTGGFNGRPSIPQQLLEVLSTEPFRVSEIAARVPTIERKRVGIELANMAAAGKIQRTGPGLYARKSTLPPPAETMPAVAAEPAPVPEPEPEDAQATDLASLFDIPQIAPAKARVITFGEKV